MGTRVMRLIMKQPHYGFLGVRLKTTSSQYVASRARDPTFEKLMDKYKNLVKVVAVQDLILANPSDPAVSVDFLSRLSQKLHLNRGAVAFLRKYPHIFHIYHDPTKGQTRCTLTDTAFRISEEEAEAINASLPLVVDRLVRLLSMSTSKMLPLRGIFKVFRELGLPDDFEQSVISKNSHLFQLCDAHEPNTHNLKLVGEISDKFVAAVENWRVEEYCKEGCSVDRAELQFSFKHGYPPGMRLKKNFRAKVKEWQKLPYVGPYDEVTEKKRLSKAGMKVGEKRAVAIVHEFLNLTVEKMVEVEKISHFRKLYGFDLNIRDLFLDHPGMFYLSTKGKRHTVFLREAYEKGCLIHPNPVYNARRKLLDLVVLGRHDMFTGDSKMKSIANTMQSQLVCSGCRSILLYPRGASNVCCALCNIITPVPPPGTEMAQLICGGCRTLLMHTSGATSVRCSCCHTVNLAPAANQFAHINCGNCRTTLMYPYGAPSVKCAVCQFVTNVMGNARVPIPVHRPSTSASMPHSQSQTVVVENPMSVDESGKLVSNVVVGVTTGKK
ncbi:PREDICTED: uncharacterized protein LOC101291798 [Fragaria vesca subsp. vesca]